MPLFEFECCRCGKQFERLVFASESDGVTCPDCGCTDTVRQFSVFACAGREKSFSSPGGRTCTTTAGS